MVAKVRIKDLTQIWGPGGGRGDGNGEGGRYIGSFDKMRGLGRVGGGGGRGEMTRTHRRVLPPQIFLAKLVTGAGGWVKKA